VFDTREPQELHFLVLRATYTLHAYVLACESATPSASHQPPWRSTSVTPQFCVSALQGPSRLSLQHRWHTYWRSNVYISLSWSALSCTTRKTNTCLHRQRRARYEDNRRVVPCRTNCSRRQAADAQQHKLPPSPHSFQPSCFVSCQVVPPCAAKTLGGGAEYKWLPNR
jgi:hypothetical protein